MKKTLQKTLQSKSLLAGVLSLAAISTFAADYYVVVPLQGKQELLNGISVVLNHTALPAGVVGVPYQGFDLAQALQVTGDPAYRSTNVGWSVVAGALPAGLTLNKGVITGTPSAAGEQTFSVRATYKTKTGEQAYKILTFAVTVALSTGTLPQGVAGVAYPTYDLKPLLTVSGDPSFTPASITWTLVSSSLPAGLTLKADGTIAGTPTASGTGVIRARATYRGVTGEQTYQVVTLGITVSLDAATFPQGVAGVAYQAQDLKSLLAVAGDPDFNLANVTWTVVSNTLPAGLTLKSDGTISGTPTTSGTGTLVARATYKGVNGEQTYQVVTLGITVGLATGTLPQGVAGVAYPTYDLKPLLTVSGDPSFTPASVSWSVVSSSLPAGLTLKADGTVSGTPTAAGTGTLVARATYKGVNGQQTYQVVTLGVTVNLATATLPPALVGQAYSFDAKPSLTVGGDATYTGANVAWSVASGALPAGLELNAATGVVSGMPTAASSGNIVLRATYRGVKGEQTYQLVSLNIVVSLATRTMPAGVVGTAYPGVDLKQSLTVTGDPSFTPAQATFSATPGTLPAGLSLSADGVLTGTPSAAGGKNTLVVATYRAVTGTQTYTFVANAVLKQYSGYRAWSDGSSATSCRAYRNGDGSHLYQGSTGTGTYRIDADGAGAVAPVDVDCDMDTDGGIGYTLLAKSQASSVHARDMEASCAANGLQLFVPRTAAHFAAARAKLGTAFFVELGIYPKYSGATCVNVGFTSATCSAWAPKAGGTWYVATNVMNGEPNGDNDTDGSMTYGYDAGGNVSYYNDISNSNAGGYLAPNWACSSPQE